MLKWKKSMMFKNTKGTGVRCFWCFICFDFLNKHKHISQQSLYNIWDTTMQNLLDKSPRKVWDIKNGK